MEDKITEQDLLCIARKFQHELYPLKDSTDERVVEQCTMCEHNHQCYQIKGGEVVRYRHNFNLLLSKLQNLTGIYLGFDNDKK